MSLKLDWSLSYPIQDGVLPDGMLVVKSRGTSGAGQFELAGYFISSDGKETRARDIIDRKISFVLPSPNGSSFISTTEEYPVREVGGKVRIAVKDDVADRPNIGNLFANLFLLPSVSSREKSLAFNSGDLKEKTYWIDDVSCRIHSVENGLILLEPVLFVFASGNKDNTAQPFRMAKFNPASRLENLYKVCALSAEMSPCAIKTALSYYLDVLTGATPADSKMAEFFRDYIMKSLGEYNTSYSVGTDPLPYLANSVPSDFMGSPRNFSVDQPRNLIFFGAPGTGKSHELNRIARESFPKKNTRRVTFYPEYTYSQFVGCFKPMTREAKNGETEITYQYVLGPFLETYVDAIAHPEQSYLLIVEEINRANPAAVFGDVFQLLDRAPDGCSEYSVAASVEMRKALEDANVVSDKLSLPSNMYIWATMNSADQGVFPMDTAFKRRWDFRYMGINEGEDADIDGTPLNEIEVQCGGRPVKWNNLRRAINDFMSNDELKINEDKLLGPFFVNPKVLASGRFASVFKDKVLLYLFEDAGKTKRTKMFRKELKTYSQICKAFDEKGEWIFGSGFDDHIVFPDGETDSDSSVESQE